MYTNTNLRGFDLCRADDLIIIRNGFWFPQYILSDGQYHYGKLEATGTLKRDMAVETADGTFLIKHPPVFSRESALFNLENGKHAGNIVREKWKNKVNLIVEGNQLASLQKHGVFSRTYNWCDEKRNNFMNLQSLFKYLTPFKVTLDISVLTAKINVPLLAFIGLQIILFKRSQAAAH